MGQKWLWGLALLACAAGCATLLPYPQPEDLTRASRKWPGIQLADLKTGRELMRVHCATCHSLHMPDEFSDEKWGDILKKMQWKAKIADEEKNSILAYVTSFDRDSREP